LNDNDNGPSLATGDQILVLNVTRLSGLALSKPATLTERSTSNTYELACILHSELFT